MKWGIRPEAMIGHSVGEYVAAALAGVFSLEDALSLVAARGRLMQDLPGGAMLAVTLGEEEIRPLLGGKLSLAAVNGPSLCVVSGTEAAVAALESRLAKGIGRRRLHTSHAFHSAMMDPVLEPFEEHLRRLNLKPPKIPFISNVTGTWITAAEATDPAYWAGHLRRTVRFADGIREMLRDPDRILLEVGPGTTLCTLARQQSGKDGRVPLATVRHPRDAQPDEAFILNTLGKLWLAGVRVDWPGFYASERRRRLPLPTYPFERQRYWIEPRHPAKDFLAAKASAGTKLALTDWFYLPSWKRSLPPRPTIPATSPHAANAG